MNHLTEKSGGLLPATALLLSAMLSACGGSSTSDGSVATAEVSASAKETVSQVQRATIISLPSQHEVPVPIADASGSLLTYSTQGFIDNSNVFFTPLGNGRACSSCHQEAQAWSVTPAALSARFNLSKGSDPIFQLVDGANSPNAPVATLAQKQAAYSMLLTKGVVRIGLPVPNGAEFQLTQVNDPYGFASAAQLSLFRRPLPTANLKFDNTVMWDGRQTLSASGSTLCILNVAPASCFAAQNTDLLSQADAAVETHAQLLAGLNAAQLQSVVEFESNLYVAQAGDNAAGSLSANGATGGAQNLSGDAFYFGINDVLAGDYQSKAPFNRNVMTLFTAWTNAAPPPAPPTRGAPPPAAPDPVALARASIARGEQLFNTRPFPIAGVNGLNDVTNQPTIRGTCSTCHDSPNAGTQSVPRLFNTGVAAAALRTADLPLYTFKNITSGAVQQSSDPGRALITGKWADIGKFKVPNLRGLAGRAPYFHNGSQAGLGDVVKFYDKRFQIGLTAQDVTDLSNFLQSL